MLELPCGGAGTYAFLVLEFSGILVLRCNGMSSTALRDCLSSVDCVEVAGHGSIVDVVSEF